MQKILFTVVMMTALLTACSSDDDNNTPTELIDNPNGKTLVVYFSKTVPDGVDASTGATQVFNYKGRELGNATGFQTRGASAGSQSNAINEWLNGLGYK